MIGIEKCSCGHRSCKDYWLTGIGKFCQGSGFTKDEAELIARLLNAASQRASMVDIERRLLAGESVEGFKLVHGRPRVDL